MAMNSSDTKSLIWKHVKYSIEFSFTFAKKHPFVSSTLSFFILFYALSPSITWFFIYSLPLMFFFTILLIVFFSIPNFKHFERDVDSKPSRKICHVDKDHDNVNIDNKQKAFLRARSVRRRKSKKHIETGAEELTQGSPFRIPFNDHDFVDKGALIEEKMKDIREVEVHSISDRAECSSTSSIFKNSGPEYSDCSYEANGKCFKSFSSIYERKTECFGDIENEGARNKAVQWKEDDQKNLMDLGLSEIERTKRLESLMARRRARKMLSLQVRRSLMNIGCKETLAPISSILIPMNKSSSTSQFSPTPGSAPSILGSNRNPFDLPYDQHEEKPNVRGGSFLQEFMSAQEQKDRNESLRIGAAFLGDSNLDQREPTSCSDVLSRQMFPEASENSRSRHRLGREDNDRVVEEVTSQASEPEMNVAYKGEHSKEGLDISQDEKDNSEVQIKSVLVEDTSNRTSSTSSSEEDGPFYKIDKDAILKSIASPALRNLSSDPSHPSSSLLDSTREDERFHYPNRPMHRTPCHSIASDLQVEVSEVGSPPLTNDVSSFADEEISIDGEIEKAITSSSEDTLMSSSHLARVDENESNSKEVREVTEQDIVDFGFSRFQMSENNVPHIVPPERLVESDSIGSSSFPPPRTERTQASSYQQRRPEGLSVVSDRFQGSLLQPEFSVQQLPFASTSLVSPTSVLQPNCLIEQGSSSNFDHVQNDRSVNISSERSDSIASQESELSLNNSILQVSELPSETETSNSALHNDSAELIIGSDSERHSENVAFSTIGQGHHSIEASSTSSSKSVSQPKFATDQLPDEVITIESCDPNTSRSSTLSLKDLKVQSSVPHSQTQQSAEKPKSLTSNDIQETLRDKSSGQHIEKVVFSTISQSFDESQASSSPQDFVVEQVPTASTSSPSPNSLIQPKFSINESSSNSEEHKRVQNSSNSEDHIPGFLSERAVNQDSISLQSTVREVPAASSSSSSPKSVLEPKSSTGQGPMLNSDREEQIGESPSPRMSRNTRTLLIDSAADKLHHADAKMKLLNDEEKSHEEATNHNDVKKEDLPKIQEVSESLKNSTTKHHKSSDVENSASTSTNKNQNLVTNTGTGEDRGSKVPEKTHGPIIANQENSAKEHIESQSERTDSKEKAKDS
nr:PREDICTED: uncharacterized protein LOC107807829 [Nicotiana tabacum]